MPAKTRDDLFTLIHKALRTSLLTLTVDAGRLDWGDEAQVEDYQRRWSRAVALLVSHARHEDEHIWPLLESKLPGAVAELGVGHEAIDADVEALDEVFTQVLAHPGPTEGLTFYRALNRFVAHALDHFANEEPAVMEMLWAACTDAELAATRAAFMAEIPPDEAAWTLELMLEGTTAAEQRTVLHGIRSQMPPQVFQSWLEGAERMLPPSAMAQLRRVLEQPSPAAASAVSS